MNKKYIILTVIIFIVISAVSYYFFLRKTPSDIIITKEQSVDENFYLTKDTTLGFLRLEMHVELPTEFKNQEILQSINQKLCAFMFGEKYANNHTDSVVYAFADVLKTEYKQNNLDLVSQLDRESFYSFNNEHVLDGFSLLSDQHIYSYGVSRYVYMGGAHGLSTLHYFNFDLNDGHQLIENDLFVDGYQPALSEIIKEKIVEDSYQDEEIPDIIKLEDTEYYVDSIKANGNFFVNEESINFVYNTYEIGPFYMGITEVNLPFERIRHLLKPGNPLEYLYMKTSK